MKKILILGVAPVQEDAIKKLKSMGYEVHAIAMKKDGPGADEADYFSEINFVDIDKVKSYVKSNGIDIIYSVGSDIAMPIVSRVSEDLGMNYFTSHTTANICNNKNIMREVTKNMRGSVSYEITDKPLNSINIDYPVFVKPSDSQGQRGISLVSDSTKLESAITKALENTRNGYAIIEKYIDGYEISVNCYVVKGQVKFLKVSKRDTWSEYEGLIHRHIIDDSLHYPLEDIREVINNHIKAVGITDGPAYAQMKIEDNKAYIIEITPRLDGCHMHKLIKYNNGIDLLELTFKHLIEGELPDLKSTKEQENVVLEFLCEKPNTLVDYDKFHVNSLAFEIYHYYKQGAMIKPINGVYDKVGFCIYALNKE